MAPENKTKQDQTAKATHAVTYRPRRGMSPIMRRILAINILALGILVAGLLYLGQYRENLIDSELDNLRSQAEMFAAALGEGAVGGETPLGQELVRETANRIVIRMVESTNTRARLFHVNGHYWPIAGNWPTRGEKWKSLSCRHPMKGLASCGLCSIYMTDL